MKVERRGRLNDIFPTGDESESAVKEQRALAAVRTCWRRLYEVRLHKGLINGKCRVCSTRGGHDGHLQAGGSISRDENAGNIRGHSIPRFHRAIFADVAAEIFREMGTLMLIRREEESVALVGGTALEPDAFEHTVCAVESFNRWPNQFDAIQFETTEHLCVQLLGAVGAQCHVRGPS